MAFDFKRHLIKVQGGRTYLPVSARIVWFREQHPDWGIITEAVEINHEKQYAVFRATVFDAAGKIMATGTKKEDVKGFGDYLEKAETGAVGRALALCGFGTQFSPELDETGGGRLADSPHPVGGGRYNGGGGGSGYTGGTPRYGNGASPAPATRVEARPDDGASMRATMDARRPAPSAIPPPTPTVSEDQGEDDFEALIGGAALLDANEDDPFGDGEAAVQAAPPKAEARADGPPACAGCSKGLTKAQQDLSVRKYGEALCPTCQSDKNRAGRTAVAER